jgi:hypothetical protein
MTTLNQELYEALIAAGAPDDTAKRAAANVLSRDDLNQLATKLDIADLKTTLAELKAEIQAMLNRQLQVMAGLMVGLTGIFAVIVKFF